MSLRTDNINIKWSDDLKGVIMNKEMHNEKENADPNWVKLHNFYEDYYDVPMQFSTFINNKNNDRRVVLFYKDYFIVVKSFGHSLGACTVKFWKGDFVKTVSQWSTNVYTKTTNRDVCFFLKVLCSLCPEEFPRIARFVIGRDEIYLRKLFIIGIYAMMDETISLEKLFVNVTHYTGIEIDDLAKGGRFKKEEEPLLSAFVPKKRQVFPAANLSPWYETWKRDCEDFISGKYSDILDDCMRKYDFGMISGTPMKSIMANYTYTYLEVLGVIKRIGADDYIINSSFIKRCGVKEKYIRSIIDEIFKMQTEE